MTKDDRIVQKKRRNVRGLGCIRDLMEECGNVKMEGSRIGESSWGNSEKGVVNEPRIVVEMGL